jgi:hypothetical protein
MPRSAHVARTYAVLMLSRTLAGAALASLTGIGQRQDLRYCPWSAQRLQNGAWKMAHSQESYTRDCVEAEHLVHSTIMRIVTEMPDAGELAQRMEFLATARRDPELRNACACVAFLSAWERLVSA